MYLNFGHHALNSEMQNELAVYFLLDGLIASLKSSTGFIANQKFTSMEPCDFSREMKDEIIIKRKRKMKLQWNNKWE